MTVNKKRIIYRSLACLSVAILTSGKAPAQWSIPDLPEYRMLKKATEQYEHGFHAVAAQSANAYLHGYRDNVMGHVPASEEQAKYYTISSKLATGDPNIVDTAKKFVVTTSNPAYKQRIAYAIAQYHFRQNELADAIPYYEMAGLANLSNAEIVNAKFELAYCYFNNRQFDKATTLFSSIKGVDGKYTKAGNYYFGLLAYNQGNYPEALRSFEVIKDDKEYAGIVPYYIAEIHYFTGNKKQALADAQKLIKRSNKLYYHNELHLLAAQVLFEEQRYGEALPYFEEYYEHTSQIRKEDLYEMGYSYYRVNEWPNAIEKFKLLSNTKDTLAQTAMYLLGDSYLKTGDKKSARNAFSICAEMPYNAGQREAATFLSSKLSYELGYQDQALTRVRALLTDYPRTRFRDEARTILSDLLFKTNNYNEAYNILKAVATKDELYWKVYQKVSYGYAIQQLQSNNTYAADSLLSLSLGHAPDANYEAAANFWKGELAYGTQQYSEAIRYSQLYLNRATANNRQIEKISPTATIPNAYMNMGYAALGLNDYKTAETYFAKAQQSPATASTLSHNALIREADAVFMQREYSKALTLYNKAILFNNGDADYARFQKALILGITGKNDEKVSLLQSLMKTPGSSYADDARYELGLVYAQNNQYRQSIDIMQPLMEGNASTLAPKAWLATGFAHQQLKDETKAIEAYRELVSRYPASEERQAALDALKSLYIENNQPGAYAQLLKETNLVAAGDPTIDSAYYAAAEAQFAGGRFDKAKTAMGEYLQQYPNGLFTTRAYYYKAESHYQLKEYNEALAAYRAVVSRPWSDYTENSARKAAGLAVNTKDYAAAAGFYNVLRNTALDQEALQLAYYGLMESHYQTGQKELAVSYADTLMSFNGVSESMLQDARLYKARSLQQTGKADEALPLYQKLTAASKSAIAAEARYQVAAIYLGQDKLKEAEDAANKTIKLSGSNDYWIVKSYILLADVLTKQKDYFNAKATLQSIVKNTKITELKEDASKKLEEVIALEKKDSKLSD